MIAFLIAINVSFTYKFKNEPYTLIAKKGKYVSDGIMQYLYVPVLLTNNTNDTLKYIAWTCPPNKEYTVKSDVLTKERLIICNATFPEQLTLPPHKSKESVIKLTFKGSFKGGSIKYKMLFDLYDDPDKYMKSHFKNTESEIVPKKLESNIVHMNIVSR